MQTRNNSTADDGNTNLELGLLADDNDGTQSDNGSSLSNTASPRGDQQISQHNYFTGFSDDEKQEFVDEIKKTYKKEFSAEDLNNIVANRRKTYLGYRLLNYIFLFSDNAYTYFQIQTSNDGLKGAAEAFYPGADVSDTLGYAIGVPLALFDWGFNMLQFDAHKEAVKMTVKHALDPSCAQQFISFFTDQNLLEALKSITHNSIILTHNLTGAAANLTELYDAIYDYSPAAAYSALGATLATGHGYYNNQLTPLYYQGLDFWANKETPRPWLIGEVFRGNIAIPLQMLIQGPISTVGLRAYPSFYYLAEAAIKTFGFWLNPIAAAVIVGIHTFASRYPKSYNHYMKNRVEFEAKFGDRTTMLARRRELEETISQELGRGYLLKEDPFSIILLLTQGGIGGYTGFRIASYILLEVLSDSISPAVTIAVEAASAVVGTGILGGIAYRAEHNRVTDGLVLKRLKAEQEKRAVQNDERKPDSTPAKSLGEKALFAVSWTIAVGSSISRALSNVGSGARTFGDNQAVVGATTLVSAHNAINGLLTLGPNVHSTLSSKFTSKKPGDEQLSTPRHKQSCSELVSSFFGRKKKPSNDAAPAPSSSKSSSGKYQMLPHGTQLDKEPKSSSRCLVM